MAYLFLDADAPMPAAGPASVPSVTAPVPAPRLSALEWSVVALARRDRLSSLRQPGRMATALRAVLKQHNPMLADERLEALRRIAVLGWHYGYTVPTGELKRFLKAGFSPEQYELLIDSIGVARRAAGDRR